MNNKNDSLQQSFVKKVPYILQWILNSSLVILALVLCILLANEVLQFIRLLWQGQPNNYSIFLEHILIFFLYFEFISMIVKYFKEDYHFPLRYFIYIGITAMIRLIIVEHHNALDTLLYALVILVLIIGYYIMHLPPKDKVKSSNLAD